jgi:uncharacterized protein
MTVRLPACSLATSFGADLFLRIHPPSACDKSPRAARCYRQPSDVDWLSAVTELDEARYISLTTFKRDGSPVSSAVWITGAAGSYVFTTGDKAWKTKRLLRNPSVHVEVCDMRGRVKSEATRFVGTGQVDGSARAVAAAELALAAKYGWQFKATKLVDGLKGRLGWGNRQEPVAVRLSLQKD